jgi:D-alanyl-D-alanine carboxypeptidase
MRRWLLWLLVGLIVAPVVTVAILVAVDRAFFAETTQACTPATTQAPRPKPQRVLDGLVWNRELAPGATAYVSGPHGRWLGAAGVADTSTCSPMPVDARMRLESVTKIYTATLILQLAQEGRLGTDDTVGKWLPGALPYGDRITIRQLLTMTSGLVDNNDLRNASEDARRAYLDRVEDAELRAQLTATLARLEESPAAVVPESFWISWAAWQPLLFTPGAAVRYSNIGYDILGLIAARAGGEPLRTLFRERIFEPLGLDATAYDPQGPISGPHTRGYGIEPDGARIDTTDWHAGVGAEGGIVSNAEDTAIFLTALMRGELLDLQHVARLQGADLWQGGAVSSCGDQAYGWSGGGSGYKTEVWVDGDASRVAVLLLNARHWDTAQPAADQAAHGALARLYCGA